MTIVRDTVNAFMWVVCGAALLNIYQIGTRNCIYALNTVSCTIHSFDWSIFSRLWN